MPLIYRIMRIRILTMKPFSWHQKGSLIDFAKTLHAYISQQINLLLFRFCEVTSISGKKSNLKFGKFMFKFITGNPCFFASLYFRKFKLVCRMMVIRMMMMKVFSRHKKVL